MRRVEKPWGYELIWAHTDSYVGKILHIARGQALSLQYHRRKDETIYVYGGKLALEHFNEGERPAIAELRPGDAFRITPGMRHRMIAIEDSDILEVSTSDLDDVVRLEDRYGRAGTSEP